MARWIVTGPPGAGKTTVLTRLAERGYTVVPEAARAEIAGPSACRPAPISRPSCAP